VHEVRTFDLHSPPAAKSTSLRPFSFVLSCRLCLPIVRTYKCFFFKFILNISHGIRVNIYTGISRVDKSFKCHLGISKLGTWHSSIGWKEKQDEHKSKFSFFKKVSWIDNSYDSYSIISVGSVIHFSKCLITCHLTVFCCNFYFL
jgi:hypothetical protein